MPDEDSIEEVAKPKRAPRKRVATTAAKKAPTKPRKTTAKKAPVRRAAANKAEAVEDNTEIKESAARKAPTVFASEKQKQQQRQKQFVVIGLILIVGIGTSAAIGYTDKGQINVAQVIEDRNERVRTGAVDARDNTGDTVEIPVQNTNKQANGGLVGLGTGGAKPKPPEDTATTTASSTDSTASSTEATATSSESGSDTASSTAQTQTENQVSEESAEVDSATP